MEVTTQKLEDFGLNSYEIQVWKSLLSKGTATAGELSEAADVPRSRSYDVLESLEKKGFVVMKIGKPIEYIAIPPKEVFRRLRSDIASEAEDKVQSLDKLRGSEVLETLNTLFDKDIDPVDADDLVDHAKQNTTHITEIIKNAEETIRIATHHPSFYEHGAITKQLRKAKQRGVNIHVLAPGDTHLQNYAKHRTTNIQAEFLSTESTTFIFLTPPGHGLQEGLAVSSGFFTNALNDLFQAAWNATQ